jgi:glutamate/aspartate transport system substrate-binding protein
MRLMTANITLACTALVAAMAASGAQAQTAPAARWRSCKRPARWS